jgi:hypothetical protein
MLTNVGRFSKAVTRAAAGALAGGVGLASMSARADEAASAVESETSVKPPTPRRAFLQYGVAFTVEGVASPGPICADAGNPCILGSGGGITMRVGFRPTEHLYLGGAYEFSKQEPAKLYRLGILQQARGELREYFPTGHLTTPFALLGAGLAGYGNEWSVDTWGPSATLGAGLELEVSGGVLLDVLLFYRPIYLQAFVDSSTLSHDAGIAQFVGLELAIEAQEAL